MSFLSRQVLASLVLGVAVSLSYSAMAQDKKALLIAEPPHGIGNLPIYVAITEGFFTDEGFDVKMLTTDGGSTHTNAVLSGHLYAGSRQGGRMGRRNLFLGLRPVFLLRWSKTRS